MNLNPSSPCSSETVSQNRDSFEVIAQLFRAFSDATRLQLLQALRNGPKKVGDLVKELELTQANVSKHLLTLHDANILKREKQGTATFYSIDDDFIFPLCELICDKINRDYKNQLPVTFGSADYSI